MAQEIEERIAHLEHALDQMSDMVTAQGREIDRLTRVVEALRQKALHEVQDQGGAVYLGDERPPHY